MTPAPNPTSDPVKDALNRRWIVLLWGGYSIRLRRSTMRLGAILCIILVLLVTIALFNGSLMLSPREMWNALWGIGDELTLRSVRSRRLPRILTAGVVGASLGVSGGLFQTISGNALGSPDIIGFTAGATAGAVFAIVVFGEGRVSTAVAAVIGGIITAALVYGLARRDGITGGLRLILVGIGMGALLTAFSSFLMVRADMTRAGSAQVWAAGSLSGRGWDHLALVSTGLVILLPAIVGCSRALNVIEMGDDAAASVGIKPEVLRLMVVIVGVGLVGIAVATTGPIAFVALAAPQIARRIAARSGTAGASLFLTALIGAILLISADLLSQALSWQVKTPVGYVTSLIGGIYLVTLLSRRTSRKP